MTRLGNAILDVLIECQYTRTILRNKNMGESLFKKQSIFQNFDEILYCGITRLENTNLDVFIQCPHTRTISRNENMGLSLFKKYLKFQKFDEILYRGMTEFRNIKLAVFRPQFVDTLFIVRRVHALIQC